MQKAQTALRQSVGQHVAAAARSSLARQLRREMPVPTEEDTDNLEAFCAKLRATNPDSLQQRLEKLEGELKTLLDKGDIAAIIARFNIKCAGNAIAQSFGLRDSRAYARKVGKLLKNNEDLRALIISKYLSDLKEIMNNNQ